MAAFLLPVVLFASLAVAPQNVAIPEGASSFQYFDAGGVTRPMTVWTYRPEGMGPTAKVVFVMHGVNRDGRRYRDQWQRHAESRGFLLVVPEFASETYSEYAYQRGNVDDDDGNVLEPQKWTFHTIERLFDVVRESARLRTVRYSLYGHSAGAQFVHRFVLFMGNARYERAVAANAGWYTMPTLQDSFPYGLGGTRTTEADLRVALGRDLVILLGEGDTDDSDPNLRSTERARAQGRTRLERGETFYRTAREASLKLGASLRWRRLEVRDAGHSNREMSAAAAELLVP